MLRLLGNRKILCDGLTRRDLLHLGGLGAFGFTLHDLFSLKNTHAESAVLGPKFGRAKSCILIYKYGSPPQHETFDPKPDAPCEIQGELKAIRTNVSGIHICDHLPKFARIMDRLTIVRSLTHPYPLHGTVYATTGIPNVDTKIEALPHDKRQWPFIGSIVDSIEDRRSGGMQPAFARNVALPFAMGSKNEIPPLAGPYGAMLGLRYDPVFTEFTAEGTNLAPEIRPGKAFKDPFLGIQSTDKLELGGTREKPAISRPGLRRSLLEQFNRARRDLETHERVGAYTQQHQMAWSLLTTGKIHDALDYTRESTIFGEEVVTASLDVSRATGSLDKRSTQSGVLGDWWREGVKRVRLLE
jgi:hypothetical protein